MLPGHHGHPDQAQAPGAVPGSASAAYLALYSVARFLLEYTRAGATGKYLEGSGGLTQAQLASILIFLLGVIYIAVTWRLAPPPVATQASGPRERKHGSRKSR